MVLRKVRWSIKAPSTGKTPEEKVLHSDLHWLVVQPSPGRDMIHILEEKSQTFQSPSKITVTLLEVTRWPMAFELLADREKAAARSKQTG